MAESSTIYCGSCEVDDISTKSTKWCTNCEEGYCENCVKAHRVNKKLRDHHIISVEDYGKIASISQNQYCSDHSKVFDFFCPTHDKIVCVACIPISHTTCCDLLSIDEAAKNAKSPSAISYIQQDLDAVLGNIEKGLRYEEGNISSFTREEETIRHRIKEMRKGLNKKLDELEGQIFKRLSQNRSKYVSAMDKVMSEFKEKEKRINEMKEQVLQIQAVASDIQTFVALRQINKTMFKEKESVQSLLQTIKHFELQFDTSSLVSLFSKLQSFGEIKVKQVSPELEYIEPTSGQAQMSVSMRINISKVQLNLKQAIRINSNRTNKLDLIFCHILPNRKFVFGDYSNCRLIFHNENGSFDGDIILKEKIIEMTCVDKGRILVSHSTNSIDIINITTRQVEEILSFSFKVSGVFYHQNKLFLNPRDVDDIYVADIDGNLSSTISVRCAVPENVKSVRVTNDKMYYIDRVGHKVICCNMKGDPIWIFEDGKISKHALLTLDSNDNMFVLCSEANVIMMISRDGKENKIILSERDKLNRPLGIHCDRKRNLLLVCNESDGYAALYDIC